MRSPRWSDSLNGPSVPASSKSGAMSPSFGAMGPLSNAGSKPSCRGSHPWRGVADATGRSAVTRRAYEKARVAPEAGGGGQEDRLPDGHAQGRDSVAAVAVAERQQL